jgi:hypothetical protein
MKNNKIRVLRKGAWNWGENLQGADIEIMGDVDGLSWYIHRGGAKDGSIGPIPTNYFATKEQLGLKRASIPSCKTHWESAYPLISDR